MKISVRNKLSAADKELALNPEQRAVIRRIHWILYNAHQ